MKLPLYHRHRATGPIVRVNLLPADAEDRVLAWRAGKCTATMLDGTLVSVAVERLQRVFQQQDRAWRYNMHRISEGEL